MKHARRRVESEESFGLRDTLIWCGIPIVIVLLVRMFLFGFYVIPSGSMLNTIEPGDRVVTSKLTPKVFKLQRGDVVVFKDPCLLYTSPSPRDGATSRMPSSA